MAKATRSATDHCVFGQPSDLVKNILPKKIAILRYIRYCQDQDALTGKRTSKFHVIASKVADDVIEIWSSFTFPMISRNSVIRQVEALHDFQIAMVRNHSHPERISNFRENKKSLEELFDISSCKCYDRAQDKSDPEKIRRECKCPLERKFHPLEWTHYCKIKEGQDIILGSCDVRETSRLKYRQARKDRDERLISEAAAVCDNPFVTLDEDLEFEDNEEKDPYFHDEAIEEFNMHQIPNLAVECDRFSVSNYAAAAVINAYLKDMGKLSPSTALDPSKIRRWRDKIRHLQ